MLTLIYFFYLVAIKLVYSSNGKELIHQSDGYITEIRELNERWSYVESE